MSLAEPEGVEWEAEDIDDVCQLLVDRHGVEGAKRRAFQVASRLKMLYPEDNR